MSVSFWVPGVPVPQGSKKMIPHSKTGRPVMLDDNKGLKGWRDVVAFHARRALAGAPPLAGPVAASLAFYLPRPAGHFGTGRNAGTLRPSAPEWPTVKPDVDKLERAIFDALTAAKVYGDDAQVVHSAKFKAYAGDKGPGAHIVVSGWPA